jgi:molecular chaperone GrpE
LKVTDPKEEQEHVESDVARDSEAAPPPSDGVEEPAPDSELAEALREKDQFRALAQRAQADLVNFRTRVEDEKADVARRTREGILRKILEIADSVDAALAEELTRDVEPRYVEGVDAIRRAFESVLDGEGIEKFESVGEQFDPRFHEALMSTETRDASPGTILTVMRTGYMRGDDVIRHALVEVAAAPTGDGGS